MDMVTRVRNLFLCALLFAPLASPIGIAMADSSSSYIVYTEQPYGEKPEGYYIQTLSAVLGSEKAAKHALLHSYKSFGGFVAKLTPKQVAKISKQPGVLQVVPNRTLTILDPIGPNRR